MKLEAETLVMDIAGVITKDEVDRNKGLEGMIKTERKYRTMDTKCALYMEDAYVNWAHGEQIIGMVFVFQSNCIG